MSKSSKFIKILPEKRELEFFGQPTVLEVLIENKISISHSCEGMGTCGTCMIKVTKKLEDMSLPGDVETEILEDRGCEKFERLACQNQAIDGLEVEILYEEV